MVQKKVLERRRIEARRLKVSGLTYREIAKKLGISRQTACRYLKINIDRKKLGACEECGDASKTLHCHHTNYETDEFQILCPSCHSKKHPYKGIREWTSKTPHFRLNAKNEALIREIQKAAPIQYSFSQIANVAIESGIDRARLILAPNVPKEFEECR